MSVSIEKSGSKPKIPPDDYIKSERSKHRKKSKNSMSREPKPNLQKENIWNLKKIFAKMAKFGEKWVVNWVDKVWTSRFNLWPISGIHWYTFQYSKSDTDHPFRTRIHLESTRLFVYSNPCCLQLGGPLVL